MEKISFDYNNTLTREDIQQIALDYINKGYEVYVISGSDEKDKMLNLTNKLGIPEYRVFATGSDKRKIKKINKLGISIHYDDKESVINKLGLKGILVK